MKQRSRRALVGLSLAAVTAAVLIARDEAEPEATALLVDRLWVERMPQDERDMVTKLALVRSVDHGAFGVHEHGSVWRQRSEVFKWTLRGDELETVWPQTGHRNTVTLRVWECEGEAPEPFELCQEVIEHGMVVATLYSRHAWKIRPRREGEELVDDPFIAQAIDDLPTPRPLPALAEDELRPRSWNHR